jgi:hypothetical protein
MAMSACSGNWIEQLGCVFIAPQTVVDLVIMAVGAGAAATIAVVALKRQLRHDRALLDEQIAREQALTRASVRRPYIEQLGNALIDFGIATHSLATSAEGRLLCEGAQAPGRHELYTVWSRLRSFVHFEGSEVVLDLWRDVVHSWDEAARNAKRFIGTDINEQTLIAAGMAADSIGSDARARARHVGATLLRWDGVSALDLDFVLGEWAPLDWKSGEWKSEVEREFLRAVTRHVGEGTAEERRVRRRIDDYWARDTAT